MRHGTKRQSGFDGSLFLQPGPATFFFVDVSVSEGGIERKLQGMAGDIERGL